MRRALLYMMRFVSTRVQFRGQGRLLRLMHSPKWRAPGSLEEVVAYDRGQIRVNTGSWIEWNIFFYGLYEREMVDLIDRVVKPGAVCLDIGANIGCHTLPMAWRVGEEGLVVAFEPNAEVFRRLEQNVELNSLRNVTLKECAISSRSGESTLYRESEDDSNRAKASLAPRPEAKVMRGENTVRTQTVDSIPELSALTRLDFVKIDTEGHDGIVLGEIEGLIRRFQPVVVFEYDPEAWRCHDGPPLSDVLDRLRGIGYAITDLMSRQRIDGVPDSRTIRNLVCATQPWAR